MKGERLVMSNYNKAYTEVLEIITYLPEDEAERIPANKLKFFMDNRDRSYNFKYDDTIPFEKNNIMFETKVIFVSLFKDYFATEKQKEKLEEILINNETKRQELLKEKYSYENLFKNSNNTENEVRLENNKNTEHFQNNDDAYKARQELNEKSLITIEKNNIFKRIINKIKEIIKINNKK